MITPAVNALFIERLGAAVNELRPHPARLHARSGLAAQGHVRPLLCAADRERRAHRQGLYRRAPGPSEFRQRETGRSRSQMGSRAAVRPSAEAAGRCLRRQCIWRRILSATRAMHTLPDP